MGYELKAFEQAIEKKKRFLCRPKTGCRNYKLDNRLVKPYAMGDWYTNANAGSAPALEPPVPIPANGFWFRADNPTLLALPDGDPIVSWPEEIRALDATIEVGVTASPTIDQAFLNGLPGIFFDSDTPQPQALQSAGVTLTPTWTEGEVFVLFRRFAAIPPDSARSGFFDLGSGVNAEHFPWIDGNCYTECMRFNRNAGIAAPAVTLTDPTLYNCDSNATNWNLRINNVLYQSTAGAFGVTGGIQIGRSFSGVGWAYYKGWFFELLGYPFVLSASERADTVDYFNLKWATAF